MSEDAAIPKIRSRKVKNKMPHLVLHRNCLLQSKQDTIINSSSKNNVQAI